MGTFDTLTWWVSCHNFQVGINYFVGIEFVIPSLNEVVWVLVLRNSQIQNINFSFNFDMCDKPKNPNRDSIMICKMISGAEWGAHVNKNN